mmetsp:Transcript_23670/g.52495  ORF Transcript_23670/g.52495 Transcript_23670/m.52495 type:complete len:358 (-) Transcript_23670:168-1241(-)
MAPARGLSAELAFQLATESLPQLGAKAADEDSIASVSSHVIKGLWTGMGSIDEVLVKSKGGMTYSFIAKLITSCRDSEDFEDKRDHESYYVEANFYEQGHAERLCHVGAACPRLLSMRKEDNHLIICMTKLQGSSVGRTRGEQTIAALTWLARLHGSYWGNERADEAVQTGLQRQGCFWHLDTRQLELERMPRKGKEGRLRMAAAGIDARLKADKLQTICHGDPKNANIMWDQKVGVSFFDFQWLGKAPPTKDLAYFLACGALSCTPEEEVSYLQHYLAELSAALPPGEEAPSLQDLQASLTLAYCDLARWMAGWGWWGNSRLLKQHMVSVLDRLDRGKQLSSSEEYTTRVFAEFPP